jgi:hypothetical protein
MMFEAQTASVLTVGCGRGFVVESGTNRYVVTAAHCVVSGIKQDLPPCIAATEAEELTYPKLLAPLGGNPWVWAQCLFVDPTADIAVLGSPNGQTIPEEAITYDALMQTFSPIDIADPVSIGSDDLWQKARGWMLSLDGKWFGCDVSFMEDPIWLGQPCPLLIEKAVQPITGGMSGSPILTADGSAAVGMINISTENSPGPHGPNPRLLHHLPGWLLNALHPKVLSRKSKPLAIANRGPAGRRSPARGMLP